MKKCSNPECNRLNNDTNSYCEYCGTSLSSITPASPTTKKSWGTRLASIGAMIVMVGFFLPWVSVSCTANISRLGQGNIQMSGYQLASGRIPGMDSVSGLGNIFGGYSSDYEDQIKEIRQEISPAWLWLVLIAGGIGLFALSGELTGKVTAIVGGILGLIALSIFSLKISDINAELQLIGFRIITELGLIMEWFGFALMLLLGITFGPPKKNNSRKGVK